MSVIADDVVAAEGDTTVNAAPSSQAAAGANASFDLSSDSDSAGDSNRPQLAATSTLQAATPTDPLFATTRNWNASANLPGEDSDSTVTATAGLQGR